MQKYTVTRQGITWKGSDPRSLPDALWLAQTQANADRQPYVVRACNGFGVGVATRYTVHPTVHDDPMTDVNYVGHPIHY